MNTQRAESKMTDRIVKQAKDIQEKLSSTLVDIDRSDIQNSNDKVYKNIPESIREIFDTFKILYKRIQNLVRSQQDEIKDIKTKIVDYEKTIHSSHESIKAIEIRIKQDKIFYRNISKLVYNNWSSLILICYTNYQRVN